LFTETSALNEDGKKVVEPVKEALSAVFTNDAVKNMSVAELRTLGATLSKLVGDEVSERLQQKMQTKLMLDKMSDEEFTNYLIGKYGPKYYFKSLSEEQYARIPKPNSEEQYARIPKPNFEKAFKEGAEARRAVEEYSGFAAPKGYFKLGSKLPVK
jgi:hypothetical protein